MITEKDERTFTKSKYVDEFMNAIDKACDVILENRQSLCEYDYGSMRVQEKLVTKRFDEIIHANGGFEIDGRTCKHAHGIGNNNEYEIVDKELIKVGSFYCNTDMHGGAYFGVIFNGKKIKRFFISERQTKEIR